jgi:O-antigen/teichoic acid export membrane protein
MKGKSLSSVLVAFKDRLQLNPDSQRETVIHNLAYLGGGTFVAQFLMALNAILLARILQPEAYGVFVATYAAAGLSSFFFNWGLDTWLLRQASLSAEPDKGLGTVVFLKVTFGVVWAILLFLILPRARPDLYYSSIVLVACMDILLEGLFSAGNAVLNAQGRVRRVSGLLLISRGARLINTLLFMGLGYLNPLAFAIARLAGTLFAWIISLQSIRPRRDNTTPLSARRTFRQAIPYGLSELLSIIYLQADILLIALITGNSQAVGLYAPASGIISALFVIPSAGFYVIVPVLTRYHSTNGGNFRKVVMQMFAGFSLLGIILSVLIWGSSQFLAEFLLGEAYTTSGELLAILSPILFLKTVSFAAAAFLVAVDWQSRRLIPQAVSAAVNIILNLLVIQSLGIQGVAYVYVFSEMILLIGYLIATARWFRIQPNV